jgi:hypothetical protein
MQEEFRKMKKKITGIVFGLFIILSACIFAACGENTSETGKNPVDNTKPLYNIVINQIYGRGMDSDSPGSSAGSHSFVELYNVGNEEADLDGYSLYCGYNTDKANNNSMWNGKLSLGGKKIPAKTSFLVAVLGQTAAANPNLVIQDYDLGWNVDNPSQFNADRKGFNNKNLKVYLARSGAALNELPVNPANTDGFGAKHAGYVDLLSITGNDSAVSADAFEGTGTIKEQSKHKAARRKNFMDTDDGVADIRAIDYRAGYLSNTGKERYRPRSLKDGIWSNYDDGLPEHIIINQIYGNADNTDGAVSHSFIELYNPTDETVSLTGYSVQFATGGAAGDALSGKVWQKLDLAGDIGGKNSFLIMLTKNISTKTRLVLDAADQLWADVNMPNKNLKVALLSNTAVLTVKNPFTGDGAGKVSGYIDSLGITGNDKNTPDIDGCETETFGFDNGQSKQKAFRRKYFRDTDINKDDCELVDYRAYTEEYDDDGVTVIDSTGITSAQVEFFRPRSSQDGAWGFEYM